MTWPQLQGHLRALARRRKQRAEGSVTDVESWRGAQTDPFFAGHFGRKAGGRRG